MPGGGSLERKETEIAGMLPGLDQGSTCSFPLLADLLAPPQHPFAALRAG